jgi:hypothetical protein
MANNKRLIWKLFACKRRQSKEIKIKSDQDLRIDIFYSAARILSELIYSFGRGIYQNQWLQFEAQ